VSEPEQRATATTQLWLLPWLVLLVALCVTWLVWNHERQSAQKELHSQFDFALRETVSRVEQRVAAYEQMLRGVQSLLATSDLKNTQAIHDYVDSLQLDANFSGVRIIGVVERVPARKKAAHVAAMRRLGYGDYEIRPPGERDLYAPVIQREPEIGRFQAPLGYDTWSDPVRQKALNKALESGMAAISGKVRLAIDQKAKPSAGFIMYLPVFARGKPHDTLAQRQANLIGWVYASFHMHDFMASLYGRQSPGLRLDIYDGVDPTEDALIYSSADDATSHSINDRRMLSATEYMVVGGHNWTLSLSTEKQFQKLFGRDAALVVAVIGVGLSVSLAVLVWLMVTGRDRALRMAAEMTEELRHMAQHDPLTKLPNRALFSDRLQHELARAKRQNGRFALIFLDLDNFKPINDNYGHAVGDKLLQHLAQRLQKAIRASDTVGRIGGDEFVVLMTDLPASNDAVDLAEKIRLTVRQPFAIDGAELKVSGSLGIAIYPDDGTDEITLSKRADEAMYHAKESGRDTVHQASPGDLQPRLL